MPAYQLEYWTFDFLSKHLIDEEDVRYYEEDGDYAEIVAQTVRNGSTVVFHGKRDSQAAWLGVFSLDEEDPLNESYLETMTDNRVDATREETRKVYGI